MSSSPRSTQIITATAQIPFVPEAITHNVSSAQGVESDFAPPHRSTTTRPFTFAAKLAPDKVELCNDLNTSPTFSNPGATKIDRVIK